MARLFGWLSPLATIQEADAIHKMHGVNYGGRFIPEAYLGLYGTEEILFKDISKPASSTAISLCDINSPDMHDRMAGFLDANIREAHFQRIASLGFDTVRLPLGYWNLIDLPAGTTPNGAEQSRWQNLQNLQPAAGSYMKWIDRVFNYAASHGLKVLLDFHSAPGGQSGNENTGCDLGRESTSYFNTDWNYELGLRSIEAMATICASKGTTCWGIALLNEPWSPGAHGLSRDALATFYKSAIGVARKHMSPDTPIVIMDWMYWLQKYWKAKAPAMFGSSGTIVFSSHFYEGATYDLLSAKNSYSSDLAGARDFTASTGFQCIITEYALDNHGDGSSSDNFPYGDLARWLVGELDQLGGSMVWNFDSFYAAWGPVNEDHVGNGIVPWTDINSHQLSSEVDSSPRKRLIQQLLALLDEMFTAGMGFSLKDVLHGQSISRDKMMVV